MISDTGQDWHRLQDKMWRCDRAIGLLRERRLNRKDANELIYATLNLLNEIRVQHSLCSKSMDSEDHATPPSAQ